ncbi:hypothetical protein LOD99_1065 [Oopsacas minuta]|uniref:Suppressor of cytokine signaling 6 n=1 Tax=Oopsacas minuta TaxID=111878 RepID=A0AAV7K334_9METZ|nr:hypothetical protein LOD99_1065 [Oopsacas minuta]
MFKKWKIFSRPSTSLDRFDIDLINPSDLYPINAANTPSTQPPISPIRSEYWPSTNMQTSDPLDERMIMQNIRDLVHHGWYWGPISKVEAENKLHGKDDGTFLVRDSSDERHLFAISFRRSSKTCHVRIEFWKGKYSLFPKGTDDCYDSVEEMIDHAMNHCKNGGFFYSCPHDQPLLSLPASLVKPISRFMQVRTLQHHCKFVIRQNIRWDLIDCLGLPTRIQEYVCSSIF